MRHSNSGKKLSRNPAHRKALFRNMAKALLTHGRIRTTEIKAKELRKVVEPLITLALRNDLHARRQAYRVLASHQLVKRLFDEIGPAFAGIPGGYTRVLKLDTPRRGDNAPMAIIELTRMQGAEEQVQETPSAEVVETAKPKATKKAKAENTEEATEVNPKASTKAKAVSDDSENVESEAKPKAPRKKAEPKTEVKEEE